MISPIWTAIVIGLLFIGMRLLQRSAEPPKWLRAVTPDVSLGWTVAAAIIGIGVIAALDSAGAFREALGAPETPGAHHDYPRGLQTISDSRAEKSGAAAPLE